MTRAEDYDPTAAGDDGDMRQLAISVAAIHDELMQRIPPLIELAPEERERRGLDGLEELHAHDLLTESEMAHLTTLLRSLRAADTTPDEQAAAVADIHDQLAKANAGPVALTIVGIASSSTRAVKKVVDEAGELADVEITTWAQADVVGGIVGATGGLVIGLMGGGPRAVLIGAGGGAAAGSVAFVIAQRLKS